MKLSELTTGGQALVKLRLEKELESWDHSAIWWNKPNPTATQQNMLTWHDLFLNFRQAVLDDRDIEEAFVKWVNAHHNTHAATIAEITMGTLNVPQFAFREDYMQAVRLYRLSIEDHETDPTN